MTVHEDKQASAEDYPELAAGAPALSVNLGGLALKNPVVLASGTVGTGKAYEDFYDLSRVGAITSKGVSSEPWEGNPSPRIAEAPAGMLNSIGLQNTGVEAIAAKQLRYFAKVDACGIVNVAGHSIPDYVHVVERLEEEPFVDAYELNISCPNVDAGGMAFGTDPALAAEVTRACRAATARPLIVKLTPNVTDIAEIARAVEDAGADAVSLINTVLGMAIDARTRRPKLARVVGGLSGPAVKPIALRMVWQVYHAVAVPILGMGGILSGEDAVEFLLAGATAAGIGAGNFYNPHCAVDVLEGIVAYCKEQGVKDVNELIGALEA